MFSGERLGLYREGRIVEVASHHDHWSLIGGHARVHRCVDNQDLRLKRQRAVGAFQERQNSRVAPGA